MISTNNYTSNLVESVYNDLTNIVGTVYTNSGLGNKTITVLAGYPQDITAYKDSLPLVILEKTPRSKPEQYEQGGARKITDNFYIYVIAGGYVDERANEFMKNSLYDKILFGFDLKQKDYINYDSGSVDGVYHTNCYEVFRVQPSLFSIYEAHRSQLLLTVWTTVKTN